MAERLPLKEYRINRSRRMPSLDGLRAVSIILVLIGHIYNRSVGRSLYFPSILKPFANGETGVSVFFVISGFLITTLLLREDVGSKKIILRNFYLRRLLRIGPPFYAYLLFIFLAKIFGLLTYPPATLGWAASYLTNYFPTSWVFEHSWSLSIEEQFYLTWPAVLIMGGRRLGTKVALIGFMLAPISRLATYYFGSADVRLRIWEMTHTRIDTILAGCLLALFWSYRSRLTDLQLAWSAGTSVVFLLLISPALTLRLGGAYLYTAGLSTEAVCCAFVVLYAVTTQHAAIRKPLNNFVLVHIGILSYGIYVWQTLFLHSQNTWAIATLPWSLIAIFAIAQVNHWVIEIPSSRLKQHFANRSRDF